MPYYNHTLASTLISKILKEFGDSEGVTWTRAEVLLAIKEGLQVIDCFAYLNREIKPFTFPTNTSFVDLTSVPELNGFITYEKLVSELKLELDRHLLEDATSTATIEADVFDNTKYDLFIDRKLTEFLLQSGMITTKESVDLPAPPVASVLLDEKILSIRRLAVLIDNIYYKIVQETEENLKAFYRPSFSNRTAFPEYYSHTVSPRNLIRFYPSVDSPAELELLSIRKGDYSALVKLPIPTNLSWVIKYGILYEYYRQPGDGYDEQRAEYCKSRWEQGITIAKNYASVLNLKILNIPITFDTLDSFDLFNSNWQNTVIDEIEKLPTLLVGTVSWNMIALSSKIDAALNVVGEIDFLRNTILPSTEDDYIQIPFELIDTLDAYAKHYLHLKFGGSTFFSGIEKLNSLMEAIIRENARLNVPSNELSFIPYKTVGKQYRQNPVEAEGYAVSN